MRLPLTLPAWTQHRCHRRNSYIWCETLRNGRTPPDSSFLVWCHSKFHTEEEEEEEREDLLCCYYY